MKVNLSVKNIDFKKIFRFMKPVLIALAILGVIILTLSLNPKLKRYFLGGLLSSGTGTIKAANHYAYGENVGWIDFIQAGVTDTALTGYAYGENIGWISLNCVNDSDGCNPNYKVSVDSATGKLSGSAYSENLGWIDFDPTYSGNDYGVRIDGSGNFSGWAYSQTIGWISFNCDQTGIPSGTDTCGTVDYRVATTWLQPVDCSTIMPNCDTCTANNVCTTCYAPYVLKSDNSGCQACTDAMSNCTTCSAYNTCSACDDGYVLKNDNSGCETCSTAMANCAACSNSTTCSSCIFPYVLKSDNSGCQTCGTAIAHCATCSTYNSCSSCDSGYFLKGDHSGCVGASGACGTASRLYAYSDSSFGSYSLCATGTASPASPTFPSAGNSVTWTCLGVSGGDNSGTCTASVAPTPVYGVCGSAVKQYAYNAGSFGTDTLCDSGVLDPSSVTFPSAGNTVNWMCDGQYGGTDSNSCTASVAVNCGSAMSHCNTCSSTTSCSACDSPYVLKSDGTGCQSCSTAMSNCATCSSSNVCASCNSPYVLLSNYSGCQTCSASMSDCSACTGPNSCTACSSGVVKQDGTGCQTCTATMSNCTACTAYNTCSTCAPGYVLKVGNNGCQSCSATMPNCTSCSATNVCSACASGFTLKGDNSGCKGPDGVCGTAAKQYAYGTVGFGAYTLCSVGTASPASPTFPVGGGTVNWTCLGVSGGSSSGTCTTTVAGSSSVGVCGSAVRQFAYNASSFGSYTLCGTGTASPLNPTFPSAGSSVNWTCLGTPNSGTCTATVAPDCGTSMSNCTACSSISYCTACASGYSVKSDHSGCDLITDFYWVGGQSNNNINDPKNWSTVAGPCVNSTNTYIPAAGKNVHFTSSCSNNATVNATWTIGNVSIDSNYSGTITLGNPVTATSVTMTTGTLLFNYDVTAANNTVLTTTGNFSQTGGTVTHAYNSTTATGEKYKVIMSIGGNLTVGASASINADGKGYAMGNGPGKPSSTSGGSYGGMGGSGQVAVGPTYGSVTAPTNLGSGGSVWGGNTGGGAVIITVSGSSTINGNISSNGGGASAYYGGSGGSVYITTGTISGSGTVSANGGKTSTYYSTGGGGRVSLVLTGAGADFSGFSSASVKAFAYDGGPSWGYLMSGAAGTVYEQTTAQGSGNGTIIIDNNGTATDTMYTTTAIPSGQTWSVPNLTMKNGAAIGIGSGATLNLSAKSTAVSTPDTTTSMVLSGGTLTTPATFSYSGYSIRILSSSTFSPSTSLTIGNNAQLISNVPETIAGNVIVSLGGLITHDNNAKTEAYKLNLTIGGNLNVNSGGSINVDGKGYAPYWSPAGWGSNNGPGAGSPGYAASYGGQGGHYSGSAKPEYGSITAPVNIGSDGSRYSSGGGAIILAVSGLTTINGTVSANATPDIYNTGTGGSVYITTGTISGSGSISSNSGASTYGGDTTGSGGRISLILTSNGADFSGFSGAVTAYGGQSTNATMRGAAGTVYEQTYAQGANGGTLIIDNNGQPTVSGTTTDISSAITGKTVGSVIIRNGGALTIESGQTLTTGGSGTVLNLSTSNATLYNNLGGTLSLGSGNISNNGTVYIINQAGSGTWTQGATGVINYSGTTFGPTLDASAAGNTVNFQADANQTIPASTYSNVQLGVGASLTANRTYALAGNATIGKVLTVGMNSGSYTSTFSPSTYTATLSGTGTPLVVNSKGVLDNTTGTIKYSGATANIAATSYYNLSLNAPMTASFKSGATTTLASAGTLTCTGSAGNIITFNATSTGSAATISKAAGTVNCDYMTLKDSTATGGATWNPGSNSTNSGNVTGWVFNTAPSITTAPSDGGSYSGSPTNVGSNITFTATASDAQNDSYYLAVCKTNSVTPHNSAAPTCGVANWCISGSTAHDVQSTCNYTTLSGDAESDDWYAFVCDNNASSLCSAVAQGSGNNGSPFAVNHAPSFTAVSDNGPVSPGSAVTLSTTASDTDTSSTVTYYACKSNDFTGTACGAAGEWCHSTAAASNPSCNYSTVYTDGVGAMNYYGYVIDNLNFQSTSNPRSSTYTISNVLPVASGVSIDSGAASENLTSGTTKNVVCTGNISDSNGYSDIATVTAKFFRSGVASGAAAADNDMNHYTVGGVKATYCTGSGTTGSCSFTIPVNFDADATDAGSNYSGENWICLITPTDNVGAGTAASNTTEINTLRAFSVTNSISYGSISLGGNTGTTDQSTTITNTGNIAIDVQVGGYGTSTGDGKSMSCSVGSVTVANEKYSTTAATAYASKTALVSDSSPSTVTLNLLNGTSSTANIYWGMALPASGVGGTCTGNIVFTAINH